MLHNHCSIHSMNEQRDNEHTNGLTEGHTEGHANIQADGQTFIVVGGGGNCVSFGTHLNKHLNRIHIHPDLLTS